MLSLQSGILRQNARRGSISIGRYPNTRDGVMNLVEADAIAVRSDLP